MRLRPKKSALTRIYTKTPPVKFALFFLVCVALALGAVSFYSIFTGEKSDEVSGALTSTDTNQALADSLDIRQAAKARYPSSPLAVVRNLGVTDGVRSQVISFDVAVDHLTEYGLMTLPTSPEPAGGYPVIVLCHGFYSPSKYSTFTGYINEMTFYSQHGFAVVKPDYRGQGLSRDAGEPDGAFYSMSYNVDVMSLLTAVRETGYLDKSDINLWGHSMGAYIAFRAAVISPDVKRLILLSGPVASLKKMFTTYAASSDVQNPTALKVRQQIFLKYGTPVTNPDFWYYASPINFVTQLKAKVQIHVGTNDKVVPPAFSASLDKALTSIDRPHEYYVYKGATHGLIPQRPLIWSRSLDFLNR